MLRDSGVGGTGETPTRSIQRSSADLTLCSIFFSCPGFGAGAHGSRLAYLLLIVMRLTFDCAGGSFGIVTVSTPFLKAADTFSSSTSSTGMRRSETAEVTLTEQPLLVLIVAVDGQLGNAPSDPVG